MDFAYAFSLFYYTLLAAKINNYFIPAKLFIKKVIIINWIRGRFFDPLNRVGSKNRPLIHSPPPLGVFRYKISLKNFNNKLYSVY